MKKEVANTHISAFGAQSGSRACQQINDINQFLIWRKATTWILSGEVRKVDTRLPGKGNSNSRGARPVYQNHSMIKWTRTRRLSIKISLSGEGGGGGRTAS